MGEPRNILFMLNNKVFTFHDFFTFTELIDNYGPLFTLSSLIIICVGRGLRGWMVDGGWLVNLFRFLINAHVIVYRHMRCVSLI